MAILKLKRFGAAEHQRLGELMRKDRAATITPSEEDEMLRLLKKATRTAEKNTLAIHTLRGGAPTFREKQRHS